MNRKYFNMVKNIKYISLFYLIALLVRYYFVKFEPAFLASVPYTIKGLLEGISPILAGSILVYGFKRKLNYSFFSIGKLNTILLIILPSFLFSLVSLIENKSVPYTLPLLVFASILYGFFEEFGWRGYLQSELGKLPKIYKYLIISVLWYVWHLDFGVDLSHLFSYIYVLAGSIGIGYVADKSKSLVLPALFHAFFNILLSNNLESISLLSKILIIVICIIIIIWTMIRTNRKNEN